MLNHEKHVIILKQKNTERQTEYCSGITKLTMVIIIGSVVKERKQLDDLMKVFMEPFYDKTANYLG